MGLDFHDRVIAIKSALRLGDIEFAEQILPPDTSILQYATECRQPDIIARVLDGGYLNWDEQLAATTLVHLAERGSAQIMQQIMQLHSPLREKHWDWEDVWIEGLKAACSNDNLSVLVWLMEHPLGRQVRHNFEHDFHYSFLLIELLQSVAERGHVAVMQYLNELGLIGGEIERPTLASIWTFHLDSVKWLVDQDLIGDQCAITCVIHNAAFHGRLDILKLFHVLDSPRDYEAVGLKRRRTVGAFSIQGREHIAFYMAAERGHVDILEWLTVNYPATGALQDKPMFNATRDGHLGALKWLHENRADLNTVFGMQQASENGHFEVVKWLYVNRLDSRSRLAITVAIQCGHFRIAYWLAEKFPDVADFIEIEDNWPIRDDWLASNFEALLFLRVMYLDMFTARSLRVLRSKCTCVQLPFVSKILLGWLQDNYPQEE